MKSKASGYSWSPVPGVDATWSGGGEAPVLETAWLGSPTQNQWRSRASAEQCLAAAIDACSHQADELLAGWCYVLARTNSGGWTSQVDETTQQHLLAGVRLAWQMGWQPGDLADIVTRHCSDRHRDVILAGVMVDLRRHPQGTVHPDFFRQAADAGAAEDLDAATLALPWLTDQNTARQTVVRRVVETLAVLAELPELAHTLPTPGDWVGPPREDGPVAGLQPPVDLKIIDKIKALLAKAESTDYEAEADALNAAAQRLMSKHSIDAAWLLANTATDEAPMAKRFVIQPPLEEPKASLLTVVANANRCRAAWARSLGFSTVVGHELDVKAVDTVYSSLLVQAMTSMQRDAPDPDDDEATPEHMFRASFLMAFASRVGERLEEASAAEEEAAVEEDESLLPVLTERSQAVDEEMERIFPQLRSERSDSPLDARAWRQGARAADQADIHLGTRLESTAHTYFSDSSAPTEVDLRDSDLAEHPST